MYFSKMNNLIKFFLLSAVNFVYIYTGSDTGPPGPFKFYDILDCDEPVNSINWKAWISTAEDGTDALSASFSLPSDIGPDATVTIVADKFVGNGWEKNIRFLEDKPLLPFLNAFSQKIYQHFREQITPKIINPLWIPAGDYKLENFTAKYTEIDTPQNMYGRFLGSETLTVNGEDWACIKLDVEILKP